MFIEAVLPEALATESYPLYAEDPIVVPFAKYIPDSAGSSDTRAILIRVLFSTVPVKPILSVLIPVKDVPDVPDSTYLISILDLAQTSLLTSSPFYEAYPSAASIRFSSSSAFIITQACLSVIPAGRSSAHIQKPSSQTSPALAWKVVALARS